MSIITERKSIEFVLHEPGEQINLPNSYNVVDALIQLYALPSFELINCGHGITQETITFTCFDGYVFLPGRYVCNIRY